MLPFILFNEVTLAIRISNGVALVQLFITGYALAKYSGLRPVKTALAYSAIGVFFVSFTILLGG